MAPVDFANPAAKHQFASAPPAVERFSVGMKRRADDFIAAAMVRRMIDAVDHRHVGKTGSRLSGTRR